MEVTMYTKDSLLSELLKEDGMIELFSQIAPGMVDSPAMEFMKDMSIGVLIENTPDKKRLLYEMLIDAANGKEVEFEPIDPTKELPEIMGDKEVTYDIDDVDGPMYMLEHQFSGCLIVQFTKTMDESAYGIVTCNGEILPKGLIKAIELAGGMQMCGIPVRERFLEYDKEYSLILKGFKDIDGNVMEEQELKVRTLPKPMPNKAYEENDNIALQAAEEGIVLLKNENNLLPLPPSCKIKLIGEREFRIGAVGAGRVNPRYSIGIKRAIDEYSNFIIEEDSQIGIIIISRPSGENFDNLAIAGHYYLSKEEEEKIKKIQKECYHTIAIINSGYPMDVRWLETYNIDAALWCGFPGMLGGKAIVKILDGRVTPSGKLPDTWSLDYWDIPSSANFYLAKSESETLGSDSEVYVDTYYEEDIYVGYRYFETFNKAVAFPFGFGLSYTDFLLVSEMEKNEYKQKLQFNTTVKNTGKLAGKEVVQIYVKIPDGKLEQPSLRLIGFHKTKLLESGQKQVLQIEIDKKNLASYDESTASWIIEEGEYNFYAGSSIKNLTVCGTTYYNTKLVKQVENLMCPPVEIDCLKKKHQNFPKGLHSGVKPDITQLEPKGKRRKFTQKEIEGDVLEEQPDFVDQLSVEELARLSVCASHGWGMHEKGEAGRIFRLEKYDMPKYVVADGNNGVNIKKPNIGMPCSNTVCATWNHKIAYEIGAVIASEAKENDIQMILAPAMNIHRNPLNGRHPEYFSEDPYLSGVMAGYQSKGLEDNGVSSCIKHAVANNCESARKRNHSIMTERAMREIYLKVYEVSMSIHQPDGMMTAYNAANGVYTAADEEMIQGIFRKEFGFTGFVMTDWSSYDTVDIVEAIQAGNGWMTPGSTDDTYVTPIIDGVKAGKIDIDRLRNNIRYMLRVVQKRSGKDMGVK